LNLAIAFQQKVFATNECAKPRHTRRPMTSGSQRLSAPPVRRAKAQMLAAADKPC
jgi:hypothetical protein